MQLPVTATAGLWARSELLRRLSQYKDMRQRREFYTMRLKMRAIFRRSN